MSYALGALVAPLSTAEFVSKYWGKRPYLGKIPGGALTWLLGELAGGDVGKLVARARVPATIWCRTREGVARTVTMPSPADAMALYESGMTMFLHNGAATPAIASWQRQLGAELGHPPVTGAASLFCSRPGVGSNGHFDALENLTIQLRGSKRWRIWPNPSVPLPLENWYLGQEVSPSLASMLERDLPVDVPDDAETFELVEGSLLYTPRGWFHRTETGDDSLSLFLGFPVASYADLFLEAMRVHLQRIPAWRETMVGRSSPEQVRAARRRVDEFRERLFADLAGLDTAFMVPGLTTPIDGATVLTRNPLASLRVVDGPMLEVTVTLHLGKLGGTKTLRVNRGLAGLVSWLAARTGQFSVEDAARAQPITPRAAIIELLTGLQAAGFIC